MAARIVGYFTKGARPEASIAKAMQILAYHAAKELDPDVREILIRGLIHSTTKALGKWKKDDPHLTISYRTTALMKEEKFLTVHAYTKGKSYDLERAKPAGAPLPNDAKDTDGDMIWPENIDREDVFYVDPPEA
ncbi:hypothetical protein MMC07_000650 [Pseudocyphellaria aurata]|nr:hypothetical protein [Pseudocyphellaria aurata]